MLYLRTIKCKTKRVIETDFHVKIEGRLYRVMTDHVRYWVKPESELDEVYLKFDQQKQQFYIP